MTAGRVVVLAESELAAMLETAVDVGVRRALSNLGAANGSPASEWIGPDDVAQLTGYKRRSIPGLVRLRGLPCHRLGKRLRFRRVDVDRWIRDRETSR